MSDDLYFKLSHEMGFSPVEKLKKFLIPYDTDTILEALYRIQEKSVEYKHYAVAQNADTLIEFYENQ